ncbi:MAG: hypothetical protein HOP27_12295 [Anaerolineales bacterium]|nr:hypothetical protein [Anaerolineales bacterium]
MSFATYTACSGQLGFAAFFGSFQHTGRIPFSVSFRGLKLVQSKWRFLIPPTSG